MLSSAQKRSLSAKAHALKPVVLMGQQGLTEAVLKEIDRALLAHELIKIKLTGTDRAKKDSLGELIAQKTQATVIHIRGFLLTLYRQKLKEHS